MKVFFVSLSDTHKTSFSDSAPENAIINDIFKVSTTGNRELEQKHTWHVTHCFYYHPYYTFYFYISFLVRYAIVLHENLFAVFF